MERKQPLYDTQHLIFSFREPALHRQAIQNGGVHKEAVLHMQVLQQQALFKQDFLLVQRDKLSALDHLFQRRALPDLQLQRPDTPGVNAVEQAGCLDGVQVPVVFAAQSHMMVT